MEIYPFGGRSVRMNLLIGNLKRKLAARSINGQILKRVKLDTGVVVN